MGRTGRPREVARAARGAGAGKRWIARMRRVGLAGLCAIGLAHAGPVEAQRRPDPLPGVVAGDGFVVRFAPGDSLRAEAVAELLEAQPPLPALDEGVPRGVTVILAPDEETFRRAAGGRPPDWSAAVAVPSLNRIVLPSFTSERARGEDPWRVVRHEWAHLALRQSLPGLRVPRWFDEGYAQWAAGWDRAQAWRLRVRVALGRTPPLDSLTFRFPGDRGSAQDAYLLSATTVEYLVDASGEEALRLFIERWAEGGRFDAALRQVYGVTTAQLEEDWRGWLKGRYGWLSVLANSSVAWGLLAVVVVLLVRIRRRRDREQLARLRATEPPATPEYWAAEPDEPVRPPVGYDETSGSASDPVSPPSGSR